MSLGFDECVHVNVTSTHPNHVREPSTRVSETIASNERTSNSPDSEKDAPTVDMKKRPSLGTVLVQWFGTVDSYIFDTVYNSYIYKTLNN